jgi:hypothetical protein
VPQIAAYWAKVAVQFGGYIYVIYFKVLKTLVNHAFGIGKW